MGSNRRYGDAISRSKANARAEAAALPVLSLGPQQIGTEPPTKAREPVPVSAWVPIGSGFVKVEGFAAAWARIAVEVQWSSDALARTAWVWASACTRLAG